MEYEMNRDEVIDELKNSLKGYLNLGITEVKRVEIPSFRKSLDSLEREVLQCQRCPLHQTKNHYVFGEGDPNASLMFIGEAPGYNEDIQGKPFVGKAGHLLTKIIKAMGFTRDEVYIANILKCRPPNNRNPQPDEIENCFPYLDEQIDVIKPEVICALGKFAAQKLTRSEIPISRLRGQLFYYRGIKVVPTFHPSYLLRNQSGKRQTWEDVQYIVKLLGKEIPKNG
jgi:uracil-DNA glycosylase family 4